MLSSPYSLKQGSLRERPREHFLIKYALFSSRLNYLNIFRVNSRLEVAVFF